MAEINLGSDTEVAAEGYFVLSWQSDSDTPLNLQQSTESAFNSVKNTAVSSEGSITITGLVDGQYFFRLQDPELGLSNTVMVEVAHHSLLRALSFFCMGLVLFFILLATIYIGHKRGVEEA